jgi:hypothetical protein
VFKHSKVHDEIRDKRKWIIRIKENTPCTDCGRYYPHYVMEFDHLPQYEKKFLVSLGCVQRKIDLIKAEMAKCELVCSNCHRVRSHTRGDWGKNFR